MARLEIYVVTTPGLEAVTAAEVLRHGVRVARSGRGGMSCTVTWPQLAALHLHLRTATRVLVRVARFRSETFAALETGVGEIDWAEWLPADAQVEARVSTTASLLYHSGAVQERVERVLADRMSGAGPAQRVLVRISHDIATVSIDATGASMHQRGWRAEAGPAPLRETLAAALLSWSGWRRGVPLLDPCAGAGTLAIEAAQMALRIPAGASREFACASWPSSDPEVWARARRAAAADVLDSARAAIVAADVDPSATEMIRANAERAGVAGVVEVETADLLGRPRFDGQVVANPPYGGRLSGDLPRLYGAIGRLADRLALVLPRQRPALNAALARTWDEALDTTNGGIPVRFVRTGG